MSARDLIEKYSKKNARLAINAAIREELPGGADLLDALTLAAAQRNSSYRWGQIYKMLESARDAAANEIARRYDLKTARQEAPVCE
ncbi:MAG: hypothetical protein IJE97_16635 [Thermoguttaceae bacterium]|nr:hypothetical protein [Thermoguttaceae bacterium]